MWGPIAATRSPAPPITSRRPEIPAATTFFSVPCHPLWIARAAPLSRSPTKTETQSGDFHGDERPLLPGGNGVPFGPQEAHAIAKVAHHDHLAPVHLGDREEVIGVDGERASRAIDVRRQCLRRVPCGSEMERIEGGRRVPPAPREESVPEAGLRKQRRFQEFCGHLSFDLARIAIGIQDSSGSWAN